MDFAFATSGEKRIWKGYTTITKNEGITGNTELLRKSPWYEVAMFTLSLDQLNIRIQVKNAMSPWPIQTFVLSRTEITLFLLKKSS